MFSMAMTACEAKFSTKFDLFIGEWPDLLAIQVNGAHKLTLFDHWHRHKGPHACVLDQGNDATAFFEIGLIDAEVRNMDNSLCL